MISISNIDRVIKSLPTRPGEFEEAEWQQNSYTALLINRIRERKASLTEEQWSDLEQCTSYICEKWPALDERPRSSIEATWSGMADRFLYQPYKRLFSSGKCTFLPEMCTVQGKIIIVDFATLIYGHETGRFINILLKLIRQRAWLRRDVSKEPNPVFLWQDEFQYFVTRRDNAFQQTCRSARVAVVCLTQNILNLSEELGEAVPGSKTKAYLGNLMLKIAHQQNDPDSAIYMADLIGKEWRYVDSFNASAGDAPGRQAGQTSVGGSRQLVYRVEPSEFSRLMKPDGTNPLSESVVYFGGKTFNCTVTAQNPKGSNYLRTSFSRDIS